MPWPDHAAARTNEELAATLDHVGAQVVEEGAGHLLRASHAYVVAGVGAPAATAMRRQQIIPAVVIDHVRCFAVNGKLTRLIVGVDPLAGFGIELEQADVAEIGAVDQP